MKNIEVYQANTGADGSNLSDTGKLESPKTLDIQTAISEVKDKAYPLKIRPKAGGGTFEARYPIIEFYDLPLRPKYESGEMEARALGEPTTPYIPTLDILIGLSILSGQQKWLSQDPGYSTAVGSTVFPGNFQGELEEVLMKLCNGLAYPSGRLVDTNHGVEALLTLAIKGNNTALDSHDSLSSTLGEAGIDFNARLSLDKMGTKIEDFFTKREKATTGTPMGSGEWVHHIVGQFIILDRSPFERVLMDYGRRIGIAIEPYRTAEILDTASTIVGRQPNKDSRLEAIIKYVREEQLKAS